MMIERTAMEIATMGKSAIASSVMAKSAVGKSLRVFTETYRYLQLLQDESSCVSQLKFAWAQSILRQLKVEMTIIGRPCEHRSILFVGNHIGYLDIPMLMASIEDVSFVAKQELKSWPLFGKAASRVETVFVKRESNHSRASTRKSVVEAIENGKRIVIFPSGTTSLDEHRDWRRGAFKIAKESGCMIQPFRLTYTPLRQVAYIDDDFFPTHLLKLGGMKQISAQIEFHEPVYVQDPDLDCLRWQYWTKGLLAIGSA